MTIEVVERSGVDDAFVSRRGVDALQVRLPGYDRFARGAVLSFAVAPAAVLAVWLVAALVGLSSPIGVAITVALAGVLGSAPAAIGLTLMFTAGRRAARGEVWIDQAERLIQRPGRAPEVLRSPAVVRVARASMGGWRLELVDPEGRATTILARAPRGSGARLVSGAEQLAEALGAKVEAPDAARRAHGLVPSSPRTWAALCHAPIDGLFVAYSLWALITSRDAFVRFAAKQSLAQLALELALFFAIVGCVGAPLALLVDAGALRAVGLGCPLSLLAVARVGVRVTAAIRANRGEAWTIPWLRPLAQRWAPPAAPEA